MTPPTSGDAACRKARIAGFLYLGTIVTGMASMALRSGVIVRGDAATTAAHILASESLFRLAFVAELIGMGCYVAVTAVLYELLKPAGRTVALAAAFFSLVGCAIGGASDAGLLAPFIYLGDASYMAAFTPDQLKAMSMTALRLQGTGYTIAMVNFGVYCALIGALIYRSGYMPRIVGVSMMFAGAGWLADTLTTFLAPELSRSLGMWTMLPGTIGEISLTLWLLFGGLDAAKWGLRTGANGAPALA